MDITYGWRQLLATLLLTPALAAQAADNDTSESEPILVRTEMGVRVDASGHVTSVELDPELPASLRAYVDKVARNWRFAPVMQDGRAVGGKTYADVNLCLMPSGDRFNVGLDFTGNGPGNADSDLRKQIPPFPRGLLSPNANLSFKGLVRFQVGADGDAELVSATFDDPKLQERHGRTWRRQVHQWLRRRDFKPEIINGQAVATTMELPIEFKLTPADSRDEARKHHQQQMASSTACQLAAGPSEQREVAMDSRFVLLDSADKLL